MKLSSILSVLTFGAFRNKRNGMNIEGQVLYSVDPAFFVWPIIVMGFFGTLFVHHWPGSAEFFGWLWSFTLIYIFVAVLTNLNVVKLGLWALAFGFLLILSKYIEALHHFPILSPVFTHLHNLHPKLDPGLASLVGWMLTILFCGSIVHAWCRGKKKFTPNQIEEFFIGEGSDITDRAGLHFITRYNDLLESVIGFGSGDIIAYDSTGKPQKTWNNILFLFFRWPRLQEILEQRVATVDNSANDPAEVEDVSLKARSAQPVTVVPPAPVAAK